MALDLNSYRFPVLSETDIIFSTLNTPQDLLQEAKQLGMDQVNHPYNVFATELFNGTRKLEIKPGIDPAYGLTARRYLLALMKSFKPKHEDKLSVMALILSLICAPESKK